MKIMGTHTGPGRKGSGIAREVSGRISMVMIIMIRSMVSMNLRVGAMILVKVNKNC